MQVDKVILDVIKKGCYLFSLHLRKRIIFLISIEHIVVIKKGTRAAVKQDRAVTEHLTFGFMFQTADQIHVLPRLQQLPGQRFPL